MSQQYYCSAATQAKRDNLVNHTDLTAKVPLRTLKHVNSLAISILARQKKMPFSLEYMLYRLNTLRDARKPFCSFKRVSVFLRVLLLWPTTIYTFMLTYYCECVCGLACPIWDKSRGLFGEKQIFGSLVEVTVTSRLELGLGKSWLRVIARKKGDDPLITPKR